MRDSAYGPGKDHDFVAVEGSSAQRKPQTAFLSYTSWSQTTDSSIRDAMERI